MPHDVTELHLNGVRLLCSLVGTICCQQIGVDIPKRAKKTLNSGILFLGDAL